MFKDKRKYFIALVLPEALQRKISEIKQHLFTSYNCKGAMRSPAHITLHMPFEWKVTNEQRIIDTLAEFKFSPRELSIELKDFNCFEPRVIYIDVVQNQILNTLQSNLVQHLKSNLNIFNQAEDRRGFHPHVTVAFRDLKKQIFYLAWEEFKQKQFSENFTCTSLHLLKQEGLQWESYREFNF